VIIIPNKCDILGEGENDEECDCSEDNLFDKAEELFLARDMEKLGLLFNEVVLNCVNNTNDPRRRKKKRPRSQYNIFMSEKMKGCGKEGAKACSVVMKESAAEWQKLKEEKTE
jgi:hypothetical protein